MAAPPVTCVMHARVSGAGGEQFARALAAGGARVVRSTAAGAPADFILSVSGISVAFLVAPGGALVPEAAERAVRMGSSFRTSFVLFLGAPPPADKWAASPPRPSWLALGGDAGDTARAMLALARALAAAPPASERPLPPPPSAAALVAAVAAMPGVPSAEAATALLCAAGTLADLACAPPHALAAVARLSPADAGALAAAFQQPSPLVLPAAVAYAVV